MQTIRERFAKTLRKVRTARALTQDDFWEVSGRTYIGALEQGTKSPTLVKLEELAGVLEVHPVTLLAMAYVSKKGDLEKLLETVRQQVGGINEMIGS
jgi:transcriptional regulator with XRE-family HTH domain